MAAALFALICMIWGSTWLAIKFGLFGVPPFLGAGLRLVVATGLVGLVLAIRGRRIALTRDDRICILSQGLLVFWLNYGAVYWAEERISSGLTAILFSTMPLMTAVLGRFWIGTEALTGRKATGIVIGMMGTALLFWPNERLDLDHAMGMLATLFAVACASVSLVVLKRHGRQSDAFVLNVFGMGIGAVCLLATSAIVERTAVVTWSPSNVLALLYLAVFGSVVAFTAYYRLVKMMDVTVVSLSTLIIPIVALILGRVVLGETVTPTALAGIATTLTGVAVAVVRRRPRPGRRAGPVDARARGR
jgi:drug/metabolite transporter (DMT)-like permease